MSNHGPNSPLIWLRPGMHVKRWLLVLILGIVLISLGLAYLLRHLYSDLIFPTITYWLTLQFVSRPARALLFRPRNRPHLPRAPHRVRGCPGHSLLRPVLHHLLPALLLCLRQPRRRPRRVQRPPQRRLPPPRR